MMNQVRRNFLQMCIRDRYYDSLTQNVEYARRAEYLCALMEHLGHRPGLTLDLACGTGSLTIALAERGIDVYGIDGSADMLSVARQKAAESGLDLLFLCQKMQKLDLYGLSLIHIWKSSTRWSSVESRPVILGISTAARRRGAPSPASMPASRCC